MPARGPAGRPSALGLLVTAVCAGGFLAPAPTTAGAGGQPPEGVQDLWQEYPLEERPAPTETSGTLVPAAPQRTQTHPYPAPQGEGERDWAQLLTLFVVGAAFFVLGAFVVAFAVRTLLPAGRRRWTDRAPATHAAHFTERRPEGGTAVSGFSFRRRDSQAPEQENATAKDQEGERADETAMTPTVQHIAEYSSPAAEGPAETPPRQPTAPPAAAGDATTVHAPTGYATTANAASEDAGLGTRIEAIVAAAEQAAAQIRRDAEVEAARIRDDATSARSEVDRTIAEAEERARHVREAAVTYAQTKQREAEEEAATIIARAEERAGSLESERTEQRQAVVDQAKRSEQNVLQLVATCRDLADDLEALGQALHAAIPPGFAADGDAATEARPGTTPAADHAFSRSEPYESTI